MCVDKVSRGQQSGRDARRGGMDAAQALSPRARNRLRLADTAELESLGAAAGRLLAAERRQGSPRNRPPGASPRPTFAALADEGPCPFVTAAKFMHKRSMMHRRSSLPGLTGIDRYAGRKEAVEGAAGLDHLPARKLSCSVAGVAVDITCCGTLSGAGNRHEFLMQAKRHAVGGQASEKERRGSYMPMSDQERERMRTPSVAGSDSSSASKRRPSPHLWPNGRPSSWRSTRTGGPSYGASTESRTRMMRPPMGNAGVYEMMCDRPSTHVNEYVHDRIGKRNWGGHRPGGHGGKGGTTMFVMENLNSPWCDRLDDIFNKEKAQQWVSENQC